MRFAERTDYALRALMFLAAHPGRHAVPAMSPRIGVSSNHLTKVVQALQHLGWVNTSRGRGGGVELAIDPNALTAGDVVRAIEPDMALVECFRAGNACPLDNRCQLKHALRDASEAFLSVLDSVSLAELSPEWQDPLHAVTLQSTAQARKLHPDA